MRLNLIGGGAATSYLLRSKTNLTSQVLHPSEVFRLWRSLWGLTGRKRRRLLRYGDLHVGFGNSRSMKTLASDVNIYGSPARCNDRPEWIVVCVFKTIAGDADTPRNSAPCVRVIHA